MKYKRVLLIQPNIVTDSGSSRPPLSLGYLAQSLQDKGISYQVLDMKLPGRRKFKDLIKRVNSFCPDLVGFTVFSLGHREVYDQVNRLKELRPWINTIIGGPHITTYVDRAQVLLDCPGADLACTNEGEDLIVELCSGMALEEIKGLAYQQDGQVLCTELRPFKKELDSIPFPRYAEFEMGKYINELFLISSRGCPYDCIFCSVQVQMGKRFRENSPEYVGEMLEYWYREGRRIFNFVDDNFTLNQKRVYKICDEIERRNLKDLVLRLSNGVRADRVDRLLLKRMKEVGFCSIGIGVEGGNDTVLKLLKKGESMEKIENAISVACELGYEVALFFVMGAPGETPQDVGDSIQLARKYPVFKVDFYNLIPFPGTELYRWTEENNAWLGDPSQLLNNMSKNMRFSKKNKPFFQTMELPLQERERLGREIRKVMREVQVKSFKRLFSPFGPFGFPMAHLARTDLVQKLLFQNNTLRRWSEKIRFGSLRR